MHHLHYIPYCLEVAKISFEMSKYETVEGSILRVYLVSDRVFQDDQRIAIDILNDTAFGENQKESHVLYM